MRGWLGRIGVVVVVLFGPGVVAADVPLSKQIDEHIAKQFDGKTPAAQTDDAAFLRRIWLDLAGQVPSLEETKRFLADASPDKRTKLVDRLLKAPTYATQMENQFHIHLMERRADHPEWRKFLRASFEKNLPWDEMVRHLLDPDEANETFRGAGHFYAERLKSYGQNPVDHPGLTRDVGRLFLGVDLQCAQCHNHLFIDDYDQQEFQGLFAIYSTLSIKRGAIPAVTEKPLLEKLKFVSVFDPTERETGPKVPFGKEFDLPPVVKTEEKPKKKSPAEPPPFSTLEWLAENVPAAENPLFAKNIVNRIWFLMMGRGLVEPLDQFHSDNPPSHPELLDLLAREFAAHKFDIKWLLRELALSQTYQRSSQIPAGEEPPANETYLVALERPVSPEELFLSTLIATGNLQRFENAADDEAKKAADEELQDLKDRYLKAFANDPREPEIAFAPSVKAALFLLNDDKVLSLLKPQSGNLVERLAKIPDPKQRADELFLSLFTRLPTDEERRAVDQYLTKNSARLETALGHLAWSMLSSMEFWVKH